MKGTSVRKFLLIFVLFICSQLVAGCKQVINSNLKEGEANEIIAVLFAKGLSANKENLKGGLYNVTVPKAEFGAAIAFLASVGLPRENYHTIGDVFPNDSVVGTPFEERARYAYAISQELSQTLIEVEGVHQARVHVVIPEQERFQSDPAPSKASIAIYHSKEFDAAKRLATIKKLVTFAVPNLKYEDVSIAMFPAGGISDIVVLPTSEPLAANASGHVVQHPVPSIGQDATSTLVLAGILLAILSIVLKLLSYGFRLLSRVFSNAD